MIYRDMPGLAPFRALEMAVTHSSAAVVLSGMDGPGPADAAQDARIASVPADSFEALFGLQGDSRLPIAFLSDFDRPNCRVLDAILTDCDAANPGTLHIVRQELPLLGAALKTASKAVIAADRQGGYRAMHEHLMRTRMVNLIVIIAGGGRTGRPKPCS